MLGFGALEDVFSRSVAPGGFWRENAEVKYLRLKLEQGTTRDGIRPLPGSDSLVAVYPGGSRGILRKIDQLENDHVPLVDLSIVEFRASDLVNDHWTISVGNLKMSEENHFGPSKNKPICHWSWFSGPPHPDLCGMRCLRFSNAAMLEFQGKVSPQLSTGHAGGHCPVDSKPQAATRDGSCLPPASPKKAHNDEHMMASEAPEAPLCATNS